jgi:DNA-binding transcriptional LysR family regulator
VAPVLSIVALQSLVTIAECGGVQRAADVIGVSQPAVSQRVRELERIIGRPVMQRDGRGIRLTADGEALLAEARNVLAAHDEALGRLGVGRGPSDFVIGLAEHAADLLLPAMTKALERHFPGLQPRFLLDRSSRLHEALDRGILDAAVLLGDQVDRRASPAGALPLAWFSSPGWAPPPPGEPLPLAALAEPSDLGRRALEALSAAGLAWTVVVEAAHLSGVESAVRGGLGVGLLSDGGPAPAGLLRRTDLPPAPGGQLSVRRGARAPRQLADAAIDAARALSGPG